MSDSSTKHRRPFFEQIESIYSEALEIDTSRATRSEMKENDEVCILVVFAKELRYPPYIHDHQWSHEEIYATGGIRLCIQDTSTGSCIMGAR